MKFLSLYAICLLVILLEYDDVDGKRRRSKKKNSIHRHLRGMIRL